MSSIDKYVEGEARACNPNVRVETRCGRIVGYIGNTKVFDIADRYGYLNDKERSIIRNSIRAYEEENQERIRREQVRLENERISARNDLHKDIVAVRKAVTESHDSVVRLNASLGSTSELEEALSKIQGCNISAYEERIHSVQCKVRSSLERIEREYQQKLREIDAIEKSVSDDSDIQAYLDCRNRVRKVQTEISTVSLPVDEINQLREEIDRLAEAVTQIKEIEVQLTKVEKSGLVGTIAETALKEIRQYRIASLDDVNRLLLRIQEQLSEIHNVEFRERTAERADEIAVLEGVVKACVQLRKYVIEQSYEAATYKTEIVATANRVINAFSELRVADYTTCSQERITEVLSTVQEILMSKASDATTLDFLRGMLDESDQYRSNDLLQADNYKEYCKKVSELIARGISLDEIEAFDPFAYETQRQILNNQLLHQDVIEAISRTRTSFLMACKAMEDMGYSMLHYNMGGDDENMDALACEAIYVIPGCEGVVWQVIVSDCNICRKLIAIQRTDGRSTSVERVKEVAEKIENSGEINEFFSRYAEADGGELSVTAAVDTDTAGSEETIRSNGAFQLNAEGEAYYDELVKSGSAEQRAHWATKISGNSHTQAVTAKTGSSARAQESERCHQNIVARREAKHHAN